MKKFVAVILSAVMFLGCFPFSGVIAIANNNEIISIGITKLPNKLVYFDDEEFDYTGLEVIAYYDDESSAVVSSPTICSLFYKCRHKNCNDYV